MPIESFFEYDVNALSDKEKEIILYQLKKMKLAEFKISAESKEFSC